MKWYGIHKWIQRIGKWMSKWKNQSINRLFKFWNDWWGITGGPKKSDQAKMSSNKFAIFFVY